jgi:hypothetical protein
MIAVSVGSINLQGSGKQAVNHQWSILPSARVVGVQTGREFLLA